MLSRLAGVGKSGSLNSIRSFCTYASREEKGSSFAAQHIHPSLARLLSSPIKGGKGSYLELEDGRKLLDYTTGIGVVNTGHCHPRIVKAAQEQVANIIHCQGYMGFSRPMINLLDRLVEIMPSDSLDSFFFSNSGSEAVENATRLAKVATGRPNIIVMDGSFHGRTYATASMTNSKYVYRSGHHPVMGGISVTQFPYCYHCNSKDKSNECCCMSDAHHIQEIFKKHSPPTDVAAIMLEPVLGEGGYVVPPKEYLQSLRKICDEHGILLILDEVQSGFGRTGKWFAVEHFDVEPDILIMAKGIASGFPLSAIASKRSLMQKQIPGSVGGTYGGNAVACAAAVATIDVIREEKLLDNSIERGEQLREGLSVLKDLDVSIDIRGLGSMNAIEFSNVPAGITSKITAACIEKGLILLTTSAYETIRFIPPLNTTKEEIDECVSIFVDVTRDVLKNNK